MFTYLKNIMTKKAVRYTDALWVDNPITTLILQRVNEESSIIVGECCSKLCLTKDLRVIKRKPISYEFIKYKNNRLHYFFYFTWL
jgi:hypothetical protein